LQKAFFIECFVCYSSRHLMAKVRITIYQKRPLKIKSADMTSG